MKGIYLGQVNFTRKKVASNGLLVFGECFDLLS